MHLSLEKLEQPTKSANINPAIEKIKNIEATEKIENRVGFTSITNTKFKANSAKQNPFFIILISLLSLILGFILWFIVQKYQMNAHASSIFMAQEWRNNANSTKEINNQKDPAITIDSTLSTTNINPQNINETPKKQALTNYNAQMTAPIKNAIRGQKNSHAAPLAQTINIQLEKSDVEPTLAAAYQALIHNENSRAQSLYQQVLVQNSQQIDALLGLAAIAQKLSHNADAVNWYQKVLAIDPMQPTALSAMLNLLPNVDANSELSILNNLIAKQPEEASFYASLGNLYAAKKQWQLAQEAYFNASRYAKNSAEYAFNLAVSLEHLTQPKLAVLQYQRALDLLVETNASYLDQDLIIARIKALQVAQYE